MIYSAYQKGNFKVPGRHDPDSVRVMSLILRPDTWIANTVYRKPDDSNADIVVPTVYTGVYQKVKNPGKSGSTEPSWKTVEGQETVDGTITWVCVNDNLMLPSESIASITITATHGISITTYSHADNKLSYTIPAITAEAKAAGWFEITTRIVRDNGKSDDKTAHFKVGER